MSTTHATTLSTRKARQPVGREEFLRELENGARSLLKSDDLIDVAAQLASKHPSLRNRLPRLRCLLRWEVQSASLLKDLPYGASRVIEASVHSRAVQNQIATEAGYAILEQEFFVSKQAALALGAKGSNREKVNALRKASVLLGIPRGNKYLYPTFQFDPTKQEIFEEVRQVNQILGSADDPWGVASWWLSSNGRLGTRPLDAINTGRVNEVIAAARSLTEPMG